MSNRLKIRFAINDDLSRIVEIYNQVIKSQTVTGDVDEFFVKERFDMFNKLTPII